MKHPGHWKVADDPLAAYGLLQRAVKARKQLQGVVSTSEGLIRAIVQVEDVMATHDAEVCASVPAHLEAMEAVVAELAKAWEVYAARTRLAGSWPATKSCRCWRRC